MNLEDASRLTDEPATNDEPPSIKAILHDALQENARLRATVDWLTDRSDGWSDGWGLQRDELTLSFGGTWHCVPPSVAATLRTLYPNQENP